MGFLNFEFSWVVVSCASVSFAFGFWVEGSWGCGVGCFRISVRAICCSSFSLSGFVSRNSWSWSGSRRTASFLVVM